MLLCNRCCIGKSAVIGAKHTSRRIAGGAEHDEEKCIRSRKRDVEVGSVMENWCF